MEFWMSSCYAAYSMLMFCISCWYLMISALSSSFSCYLLLSMSSYLSTVICILATCSISSSLSFCSYAIYYTLLPYSFFNTPILMFSSSTIMRSLFNAWSNRSIYLFFDFLMKFGSNY